MSKAVRLEVLPSHQEVLRAPAEHRAELDEARGGDGSADRR
jgi:hypothetical protein